MHTARSSNGLRYRLSIDLASGQSIIVVKDFPYIPTVCELQNWLADSVRIENGIFPIGCADCRNIRIESV
jgi:hypothetical protein